MTIKTIKKSELPEANEGYEVDQDTQDYNNYLDMMFNWDE